MKPLNDLDFLRKLYNANQREVFAKIISLTFDEKPIEEISGKVTQGSVSVDGTSAVRRTCSLTLIAEEFGIHEYYWGLNTKFKLYVGLKNNIDDKYDSIIWFPLGVYLITSFNTTQNTNSYQISLQGKDKMCLLNGDIGGVITAKTVDFGNIQSISINDDGEEELVTTALPLKQIIREVVHEYAKEPYYNIIINDLDEAGLQILKGTNVENTDDTKILGYIETDLIYAGELKGQVGNSITSSCLDKIKSQLVDYEYFYNLDGQFVFQKKNNTLNYLEDLIGNKDVDENTLYTPYEYSLLGSEIVTAFQNQPNLLNVKNDFAVWGSHKSSDGNSDIDFHVRYAIDKKPTFYKSYDRTCEYKAISTSLTDEEKAEVLTSLKSIFSNGQIGISGASKSLKTSLGEDYTWMANASSGISRYIVDWREIIYHMAEDWLQYGQKDDFNAVLAKNNRDYYPTGYTGYEQYYTDIDGFWETAFWDEDGTFINSPNENSIFWFDFLDTDSDIWKYSVPNIGTRIKAENSSDVKLIDYEESVPLTIYRYAEDSDKEKMSGYTYYDDFINEDDELTIDDITYKVEVTSRNKTAMKELNTLLENYSYCTETASVTLLPIYHLEPNLKILIKDDKSGINGEYIISKITIPLAYNGTMTINATKAISNLF